MLHKIILSSFTTLFRLDRLCKLLSINLSNFISLSYLDRPCICYSTDNHHVQLHSAVLSRSSIQAPFYGLVQFIILSYIDRPTGHASYTLPPCLASLYCSVQIVCTRLTKSSCLASRYCSVYVVCTCLTKSSSLASQYCTVQIVCTCSKLLPCLASVHHIDLFRLSTLAPRHSPVYSLSCLDSPQLPSCLNWPCILNIIIMPNVTMCRDQIDQSCSTLYSGLQLRHAVMYRSFMHTRNMRPQKNKYYQQC